MEQKAKKAKEKDAAKIDFTNIKYEEARDKLAEYIKILEDGTSSLDETIAIWNQAKQYVEFCQKFLEEASKKISQDE